VLGRRILAGFNAGDQTLFLESLDPDCVLATDPRWPGGGEFHGVAEIQRFTSQFLEAFAGVRFEETHQAETIGDWGHFRGRWVGQGLASQIETASFEFSMIVRLVDGRIAEARYFFDTDEAREFARSRI
jgi:ketosteroid isomerase-like protein